jgi:hypothetical protein
MFKIILVLKVIVWDGYAEAIIETNEKFRILKNNPNYDYCIKQCKKSFENKKPLGIYYTGNHELTDITLSEESIVSSIHLQNEEYLVGMLPLSGVYKLLMKQPNATKIYVDLVKSEKDKKKITIYLTNDSNQIFATNFAE